MAKEENRWGTLLDVDYAPNEMLANAATAAGIDLMVFPCKSWSRINQDNTAVAAMGYGRPAVEL